MLSRTRNRKSRRRESLGANNSQVHTGPHPIKEPISVKGFPDISVGKEFACNAGDPGSIPVLGRSSGEEIGYPLHYSWASFVVQLVKNLPVVWET